jgi:hypothetical protein
MRHSIDPPLELLSLTLVHFIKFEILSPGLNQEVCGFFILTAATLTVGSNQPSDLLGKKEGERKKE